VNILVIVGAYLFPSEGRPNAGIFFANLLKRWPALGARVVVVSPTAYIPAPLMGWRRFAHHRGIGGNQRWHGMEVFRPRYVSISIARHNWLQARSRRQSVMPLCLRLHRRIRFDLVLGFCLGPSAYAARCAAEELHLPCATWAIGSDVHTEPNLSAENADLFRHNVRHCDLMLAVSEAIRRQIVKRFPRARHVHTFYRGIDLDAVRAPADRPALRAELQLPANRLCMLSAGSVQKAKGVYEFYEAFKALAPRRPELSAVWVGAGAETPRLRDQAGRDGLSDRFTVTGLLPRRRVLQYMHAADVLAFPSHAEGLPNVVMEAMAARLPAVATDVGGTRELIVPEVTGMLVPPRDVPALADAVAFMLDHPRESRRMARRGRQLILEHFDVDRNAPVALSLFERVASGEAMDVPVPACAGTEAGCLPADRLRRAQGT
jgi:glycosyltransferase involved in cell wall biosynthesis